MGYEPTTNCTERGDQLDVYQEAGNRFCEACRTEEPKREDGPGNVIQAAIVAWNDGESESPFMTDEILRLLHFDGWLIVHQEEYDTVLSTIASKDEALKKALAYCDAATHQTSQYHDERSELMHALEVGHG